MFLARRRRRRDSSGPLVAVALVILLGLGLLALIEGPFGIWLAAGLAVAAVLYGRIAQQRQAVYMQRWCIVDRLRMLSGIEFEKHVAELYRRRGYRTEITRGSGDQGVDVIAQNDQHRIGIQCKQWQGNVGNDAVQEAMAGKVFYNCSHAAVVCTSTFTPLARQLAERSDVQLIDGATYANMVNEFAEVPVKTFASQWIPRGKPLFIEVGALALAVLVFMVHAASPVNFRAVSAAPTASVAQTSSLSSTVQRFYDDINAKRYYDAYALLSPAYQAGQSYSNFVQGYSDTLSVTPSITPTSASTVEVQLEAREKRSSGSVTSHYVGLYRGIVNSQGHWLLDGGTMRRVL